MLKLAGFYNQDEKCLLRGTNWVFKYNSLRFVFNPYPANVDNMASSYQCQQMADGI